MVPVPFDSAAETVILPATSRPRQQDKQRSTKFLLDICALVFPFAALVGMFYLSLSHGLITYPYDPVHPYNWVGADYYAYVNMSFAHGNPQYAMNNPFLWRILVPKMVFVLSQIGVPFRTAFWYITTVTLCLSTLITYYLARGMGLSRISSAGAVIAFVTLQWSVAYNVHDYFMVDTTIQMFIVALLLAQQRNWYILAICLATIGAACKETIFLPIAFIVVQWLIGYLKPLPKTLGMLVHGRIIAVIKSVPRTVWLRVGLIIILPLTVSTVIHALIHPPPTQDYTITWVWNKYLNIHFTFGIPRTIAWSTYYTYGNYVVLALGALLFGLWRKTTWSGWALLTAGLIILYSYAVSGDTSRLSIVAWPFVVIMLAMMVEELYLRLHIPLLVLWGMTLMSVWVTGNSIFIHYNSNPISPFSQLFLPEYIQAKIAKIVAFGVGTLLVFAMAMLPFFPVRRKAPVAPARAPLADITDTPTEISMAVTAKRPAYIPGQLNQWE